MSQIFLLVQISPPLWVRERLLMSRSKIGRKRRSKILQNRRGDRAGNTEKIKNVGSFSSALLYPAGASENARAFFCASVRTEFVFLNVGRGGGKGGGRDWYVFFVSLGNRKLRFSFSSSLLFLCAQKKQTSFFCSSILSEKRVGKAMSFGKK